MTRSNKSKPAATPTLTAPAIPTADVLGNAEDGPWGRGKQTAGSAQTMRDQASGERQHRRTDEPVQHAPSSRPAARCLPPYRALRDWP